MSASAPAGALGAASARSAPPLGVALAAAPAEVGADVASGTAGPASVLVSLPVVIATASTRRTAAPSTAVNWARRVRFTGFSCEMGYTARSPAPTPSVFLTLRYHFKPLSKHGQSPM